MTPLLTPAKPTRRAMLGWATSSAAVALCLSGLAALAMAVAPPGESLGQTEAPILLLTPPAPALSALSEPAPDLSTPAPSLPEEPQAEDPIADTPTDVTPVTQPAPTALPDATSDPLPTAELSLPDPAPKTRPKPRPDRKPEPQEKQAETQKPKEAPAPAAAAPASRTAATSAGTGKKAVANYGAQVMKTVRKTRKEAAPAKGIVVVGFTVAADGGLAGVQVVQSSGHAGLDQVAMDHIRRAAPFPVPPEGANRSFAFEFVGK